MGLPRTTSCLNKNNSKCGGALVTGNGAKAKEAVTSKLPWQDNVNAGVDVVWQTPPLCKYLMQDPRAGKDQGPPGQREKHHERNKVRSNNEETGCVQST